MFPFIETHPPTFNGVDLLFEEELEDDGLKVNTICACELCAKLPKTTKLDEEEMLKFALFSKFP